MYHMHHWMHFTLMWCGCSPERPWVVAVAVLQASPIPCFVAAMQTTTVTTNIHVVWLVWRSNLLLIGVTYSMELIRMMLYHECERWHDMMTEWDSYQMLLLISTDFNKYNMGQHLYLYIEEIWHGALAEFVLILVDCIWICRFFSAKYNYMLFPSTLWL